MPHSRLNAAAREGGVLVAQVHQLSGRVFSRILRMHGVDDLNPAQGRIIYALWQKDGQTQTELARRTKLDKSTLALMLGRLEDAGQIRREGNPCDGRTRHVHLTEKNRALHGAYLAASKEMLAVYYNGLAPEAIDAFEGTLRHILQNLEAVAIEP